MSWNDIKDAIEAATGLGRDALHIYFALLIQIGSAAVLRRRVADWLPWLIVLGFAVANEYFDAYVVGEAGDWELSSGLHDLWNTMVAPTMLLLLTRFAPRLAVRIKTDHAIERETGGTRPDQEPAEPGSTPG